MSRAIKTWFDDLKTFNWKIFFALCLLSLVPAIYQTVITYLITSSTSAGALDIVGQMEWFDLIDETICAFLIVPMYSVLTKAYKEENFAGRVFKLGIIIFALYALFSVGVFFYGIHLIGFMNLKYIYHADSPSSDPVHHVENILVLAADNHADGLAQTFQLPGHVRGGKVRIRGIRHHHHVEITLDDGLGNIFDIDPVLRQIGAYFGDDADGIPSDDGNDGFLHTASLSYHS